MHTRTYRLTLAALVGLVGPAAAPEYEASDYLPLAVGNSWTFPHEVYDLLQVRRLAGRKAIAPGRFRQDPPHVAIAGLGNRPSLAMGAAGVFAGHQTDKGHQLPRRIKAREVPQLGQGGNGGEHIHPPKRHQTACLRLQRPAHQRLLQLSLQSLDPGLGLLHQSTYS